MPTAKPNQTFSFSSTRRPMRTQLQTTFFLLFLLRPIHTTPISPPNAHVTFSIDNSGQLYLDGVQKANITHWTQVRHLQLHLHSGSTISIIAHDVDKWFGVIVDVQYTPPATNHPVHYVTGSGIWKAVRKHHLDRYTDNHAWMHPQYSTCRWPNARIVHPSDGNLVHGMAPSFPYMHSKARYVWAQNADEKDTVFLRMVVGGENCTAQEQSVQQWKKEKAVEEGPDLESADSSEGITGQEGSGDEFCACRIVQGPVGECWEYEVGMEPRCRKRNCGERYECDVSGVANLPICMRRVRREKIVPIGEEGEVCETQVVTNSAFYVLYAMPEESPSV